MVEGISIEILGPLRIAARNQYSTIGASRVRTLLAVLAFSPGEVVSIDFLISELFSEQPSKNPKNALQANMRRLRTSLEAATGVPGHTLVSTSANGYLLNLPPDAVDAERFSALAARGAALVHERPQEATTLLEEALTLWRGLALLDVSGGLHCQAQLNLLNNQRLGAFEDLYEARLLTGSARSIVNELEQLTISHPERERIAILLILALYQTDRQGDALAAFQRIREWLNMELGLEPGKKLRRLQRAILTQDPSIDSGLLLMETL